MQAYNEKVTNKRSQYVINSKLMRQAINTIRPKGESDGVGVGGGEAGLG